MDLFADLRNRLPFRSARPGDDGERLGPLGEELLASDQFLVAQIDRSGLVRAANPALCRWRGAAPGELLGTGLLYLVNAGERAPLSELVRAVFAGHRHDAVVARLLTGNGSPMPAVRWSVLPLRADTGECHAALCIGIALPPHPADDRDDRAEAAAPTDRLRDLEKENASLRRQLDALRSRSQPPAPVPPLPVHLAAGDEGPLTLAEVEGRHLTHILRQTKGRVSGPKGAAALLGLHPNTLRSRMEKLGIGKTA